MRSGNSMVDWDIKVRLNAAEALLEFCQKHGDNRTSLLPVIEALREQDLQRALDEFDSIPLGGTNGCFDDWFVPENHDETSQYAQSVFEALVYHFAVLMRGTKSLGVNLNLKTIGRNRKAKVLGPNEGELYDVVGDRYRFLATKDETDRSYALIEAFVPPGGGPPPHLHTREEEGFYIIEGEITLYVDGEKTTAKAGSFVNIPKGCTHAFKNESDSPARMLILIAPGGLEEMFRIVGAQVADGTAPIEKIDNKQIERLVEVTPNFGIELKIGK